MFLILLSRRVVEGAGFLLCCLGGRVFIFLLFGWVRVVFVSCFVGGPGFTHIPFYLARLQGAQQQKRPNSKTKNRALSLRQDRVFCRFGGVGVQQL